MKAWHWAAIGVGLAVPLGALFFIATAVNAAWGGGDVSGALLVWLAGFLIGVTAAWALKIGEPWGPVAAWASGLAMLGAAIVAAVMLGRPQPLLFAVPAVSMVVAGLRG